MIPERIIFVSRGIAVMVCIFQCKYSNMSKLHKKFEGSKELHVQNHCVFPVFFYRLTSRSLSFQRGSWSAIRRKFCVIQRTFVLLVPNLSGRGKTKTRTHLRKIQNFVLLLCLCTIFSKTLGKNRHFRHK